MSDADLVPMRRSRRAAATVLSILISGAVLAVLYSTLEPRLIASTLANAHPAGLLLSVAVILPITVLRAARFFWVAPAGALPGFAEALRLTLVASALNVFLPAKSGDLIKSYFVARRSATPAGVAIAVSVYERLCDVFALIVWCVAGWLLARPIVPGLPDAFWWLLAMFGASCGAIITSERASAVWRRWVIRLLGPRRLRRIRQLAEGWPDLMQLLRGRRRWIVAFSLVLWLAHLVQIWTFTIALGTRIPFTVCASLAAVALMAGQLPFTIAGLGTRDVALVLLLSRYMAPESAAAMGVLIATRGLLPPLVGLPMMRPYVSFVLKDAVVWRRAVERPN